ncbi:MAG: toxic anion resistance protein [Lachnospiraceae bacterium]|nr:toxic anion resistance protein [Lachnospiraceae bacterium]
MSKIRNHEIVLSFAEDQALAPFTPQELAKIESYQNSINLDNSTAIIEYGTDLQKKLSELSGRMLALLNTQNVDDINQLLTTTIGYLQTMEDEKGRFSLFNKKKEMSLREKYRATERNVDRITVSLQDRQLKLMKDCAMLTQMQRMNDIYQRDLNMKITAGRQKIQDCKQNQLPALEQRASETGLVQDSQAVSNHKNQLERLEKKLHELELSIAIAQQSAPLIQMIQSNQTAMATKLQSTLLNTIPLWKNQVVLALGMEQAKQASSSGQQANEMMNKLLNGNKEAAKLASVSTMEEASRNFTEVSDLESTNKQLIESLTKLNSEAN